MSVSKPPSLYEDDPALTTIFDGGRPTVRHLRKSKLVVTSGADAGREVEINKPRVTGGRSIINDLVLSDKAISGSHFEIAASDGSGSRDGSGGARGRRSSEPAGEKAAPVVGAMRPAHNADISCAIVAPACRPCSPT